MMKERVAAGTLWSFLDLGGGQVLGATIFLVLARLIAPDAYGVFAIAVVLLTFANVLLIQGFGEALVQRATITEAHRSTAFWANLALGISVAALFNLGAPWLATAYRMPELSGVLRWISICCILNALSSIHLALLRRDLKMAVFPARTLLGYAIGGVAAIIMALHGWGVWALVGNQLGIWTTTVLVVWSFSAWHPRALFSLAALRDLVGYASYNTASNLILGVDYRVDSLIVGIFFNAESVGYYALGQRILHTLGIATLSPIVAIALPLLSRESAESRFSQTYLGILRAANVLWLPACLGFGLLAPTLMPVVFGAKWNASIPLIQALSLAAFTTAFTTFTVHALGAVGRPQVMTALASVQIVVTFLCYIVGARFGLLGVAFAWPIMMTVMAPIHLLAVHRMGGFSGRQMLADYGRIVTAALGMAVAILMLRPWVHNFVMLAAIGGAVYVALLSLMLPGYLPFLITTAMRTIMQRRQGAKNTA